MNRVSVLIPVYNAENTIGMVLILYSVAYAFYKAYDDINTYGKLSDFETLMSANMFFRGLVLIAISIMGEYVGRIYMSVSRDPQFVIREILGGARRRAALRSITEIRKRDGSTGT